MRKPFLAARPRRLATLGAWSPVAAAQTSTAKVVIIVGADTPQYLDDADALYAEAIKHTPNVIRVYSPNATWSAVKSATNGANVVIYLGHGNGWPSPYTYDPSYTTKDGFGLNASASGTHGNLKYYGEPSIRTLAARAERRRPPVPPLLRLRQLRAGQRPSRRRRSPASGSTTTARRSSRPAPRP